MFSDLAEVWRFRELLRGLVIRSLKIKYKRSSLGFVWTLLNPLLTLSILLCVFTFVVRIDIPHYWAFLISGYFAWNSINQALSASASTLHEEGTLIRSIAFPVEIPVLALAIARLLEFLVGLSLVLLAVSAFHHGDLPFSYVLIPFLILLQLLLVVGLALPIATVSMFYTDFRHLVPVGITALFYITPVFYSADMVPEAVRGVYLLNPIAGMLHLYHRVIYDGIMPSAWLLALTSFTTLSIGGLGYTVFRRNRHIFPEVA